MVNNFILFNAHTHTLLLLDALFWCF